MFKQIVLFFIIFVFSTEGVAAGKKLSQVRRFLSTEYKAWDYGLTTWQESFNVESFGNKDLMTTRFEGLVLAYTWNKPFKKKLRWLRMYGLEGDLGYLKGSALKGAGDQVKNQMFLMASGFYGYRYRTTMRSEVNFFMPLTIKTVMWSVEDSLKIEDQMYSVGLGGSFTFRMGLRSSISLQLSHQFMWDASVWSFRYTRDLR